MKAHSCCTLICFAIGMLLSPLKQIVVQAAPAAIELPTNFVVAPFTRCGSSSNCDLRTHYCDELINMCARCDDDCHPARINGDPFAMDECRQKCQWYYVFTTSSTVSPAKTTSSQPVLRVGEIIDDSHQTGSSYDEMALPVIVIVLAVPLILALVAIIVLLLMLFHRKNQAERNDRVAVDYNVHGRPQDDARLIVGSVGGNQAAPQDDLDRQQRVQQSDAAECAAPATSPPPAAAANYPNNTYTGCPAAFEQPLVSRHTYAAPAAIATSGRSESRNGAGVGATATENANSWSPLLSLSST